MLTRELAFEEAELLRQVVAAARALEPAAQVVLYGSRARGDAAPDSDWDLLVLLDGPVDRARDAAVRRRIYAVERSTDACPVLSVLVESRQDWESPALRSTPLHTSVERDGIAL